MYHPKDMVVYCAVNRWQSRLSAASDERGTGHRIRRTGHFSAFSSRDPGRIHCAGTPRQRGEVSKAPRWSPGSRDLYAGPARPDRQLERRSRAHQGLHRPPGHRPKLLLPLPSGRDQAGQAGGDTPHSRRRRPARRTGHARAERRLALPGKRDHYGAARSGWCSAGVLGDQPRPHREQGVRSEVSRPVGSRSGCDGGGRPGWRDRPAERSGGEAIRLPPR